MADPRIKINFDEGIEYSIPAERRPPGGVSIRRDPETGADVFMYKAKPGVFFSAHGSQVAQSMAKRAGFDVDRLSQERTRQLKMAEFESNWRAQNAGSQVRIVTERNGYRLEERPELGYYVIHIETGTRVTKEYTAKSEQQGLDWLSDFAGPPPETEFDGTPESVKVADGDIQRASDESFGRVDRRPRQDARPTRKLRPAGDQEAAV